MRLDTERLFIREWRDSDVPHYLRLSTDVGYNNFAYPGYYLVKDEAEALEKIRQRQKLFQARGLGKFPVFLKNGEFVGTCGIDPYTLDGSEQFELGYRMLLDHWGNGYATEAAKAVLSYAQTTLSLGKVLAFAVPQNPQSLKIIEKLGFRYQRLFRHAGIAHKLYELN